MMEKSMESTGKTIELAVDAALKELGMDRDSVSVEVLEKPRSGFLGMGGSPARVKVSWAITPIQVAEDFLAELLRLMKAPASASVQQDSDGNLKATLLGEELGTLIGRRGETLDAIQHVTAHVVSRVAEGPMRVTVDAENYRQKREDALIRLAKRTADSALRYRKNITLEPMNAYERHVIHTALQDVQGISTFSTGFEPMRRVVVSTQGRQPAGTPAPAARRPYRGGKR